MFTRPSIARNPLLLKIYFSIFSAVMLSAVAEQWVYFGTYTGGTSKGIYVSRLNSDGHLTPPELAATITNPSFLAVEKQRHLIYAVSEIAAVPGKNQGDVVAYSINPTNGALTKLNDQPSGGDSLCHVQLDATGKTVLVASYGGGSISTLPVNADGSLGKVASFIQHHGSSINPRNQTGPHAHCVVTDPANRFALACDLGLDKILVYKLDAGAATISRHTPAFAISSPGSGPRHLAFHPSGKHVYVVNEMGCNITTFAYDAEHGALTEIESVSALPPGRKPVAEFSGAEIAVHPSGKFLYASTRGIDQLNLFAINARNGTLTLVENISSGGKTPRQFSLDPAGEFLFAANQNSDNVTVFKINPVTGRLTPTGQVLALGNPSCVVFAPTK